MSASLVGSEMCIRDRYGFPELLRCRLAAALPFGLRGPVGVTFGGPLCLSLIHILTLPTICSV
eukprot:878190-Alexandrium_andersonii.AAC.1